MTLPRKPFRAPATERHAGLEARLVVEYWRTMQAGDIITYAEMQELTGQDLQKRRDILYTACQIVETQDQLLFRPITGVGYQCLGNAEKVRYVQDLTRYVNRRVHRNLQRLTTVDVGALSPLEQLQYMAQQTMNAAAHLATHRSTQDALVQQTAPVPLTPFDREAHARLVQLWGPADSPVS